MQWTNSIAERNLGIRIEDRNDKDKDNAREKLTPKLHQNDRVKAYVAMQKAELGSLLKDIEEGKELGDWRKGGPPAPRQRAGGDV
jgi:hypothetical protein